MDYKDLIDTIRTAVSCRESDCYNCEECIEAVAAIETLLEERDKAQSDLLDIQATLDMYGGECGITAAFLKTAERDAAVAERNRLKELAEADARGMVLVSKVPIGTTVYQLHQGSKDEVRIIDGEEYTRKVPNWYITHHKYSWVDAIADAECPERRDRPNCRYYFTLEEARAERDRINAGGNPNA